MLLAEEDHSCFNIILDINEPLVISPEEQEVLGAVDHFLRQHGKHPLKTVANTVFPEALYRQYGAAGVFQIYPDRIFPKIKKDKGNRWGTYVHRMVRRTDQNGRVINPLEKIVSILKAEGQRTHQKRARYELGLVDPFTDISIADPTLPFATQAIGGPCLSHLSFKLDPKANCVRLVALYRSHYYMARALGNLVGLSRLLSFVAREAGLQAGGLTCISSYAKLDTDPWSLSDVRALISQCKDILSAGSGVGAVV